MCLCMSLCTSVGPFRARGCQMLLCLHVDVLLSSGLHRGRKKKKTVCLFRQACFEAQVSLKVIVINNPPALASKHWGYRCVIIFS